MPGTTFQKQSDISTQPNRCFDTQLSQSYSDVFAGKLTTADITDMPYKQGLFLEVPTAETPNYGSGEVRGYELGLYVNSMTGKDIPELAIWKAKKGITDNVGTFGTDVVKDIYSMTSFISDATSSKMWETNFGGAVKQGMYVTQSYRTRTIGTGPYTTPEQAWEEWSGKWATQHDYESFEAKYASNRGDGTRVVFLQEKMDPVDGDVTEGLGRLAHNIQNGNSIMDGVGQAYAEYHWYVKNKTGSPFDGTNDPAWNGGVKGEDDGAELDIFYDYEVSEKITESGTNTIPLPVDTSKLDGIPVTRSNDQMVGKIGQATGGTGTVQPLFKSGFFWEEGENFSGTKAIRADLFSYPHVQPDTSDLPEVNADYSGYMQAASFHRNKIMPGITTTKDAEQNSSEANSSSTSNKNRQKVCITLKIKNMSNIVAKDSSSNGASFPSRGMAVWFKNRFGTSYKGYDKYNWNIADDIRLHHYEANTSNFEGAVTALSGTNNVPFCGFILYKHSGQFYIKSIGKEQSTAGFSFTEADETKTTTAGAADGGQFPHFNFDPNTTSSTYGHVATDASLIGKWIQLQMSFDPRGSGFTLNVVDKETGELLCDTVTCWSSQAASDCNLTTAWGHLSVAAYGCASLGTTSGGTYAGKTDNINFRPNFSCLSTPASDSEVDVKDNQKTHTNIIFDNAFITQGGSNYKHINSTLTNENPTPGKIGISHRTAVDTSGTSTGGDTQSTIEETTGLTPATFWSFGTKNKADIAPSSDAVAKYLYFSGFTPEVAAASGTLEGIDSKYMKWAWTTASPKLGLQLWGKDNAGSTTDDGNLGASMFTHGGGSGQNRIYFNSTTLASDAETNGRLTSLLSNEFFTQSGHVAYASEDVSDAASMHSTIVKRENIFCSGRVLATTQIDETALDDLKFLRNRDDKDEEYIMYVYGARNAPTNYITNLKLNAVKNSSIGAGAVEWSKNIIFSDAHRTLTKTPLGTTGASVTCGTDEKITWSAASNIKLSDGTQVALEDYFNVGDDISVAVSGSSQTMEGSHTIVEVGTLYLKIDTAQGSTSTATTGTLTIKKLSSKRDFNVNRDSEADDVRYDDSQRIFVSPNRYWLMAEIFNYAYDTDISTPVKLPNKTYNSVIITDLKPAGSSEQGSTDFSSDSMGATWNEWKISDSYPLQRPWNMTRDATKNQNLITGQDFGYGAYVSLDDAKADEVAGSGGYVQRYIPELTIEGNPQTNLIDISSIRSHKEYEPAESIYLWVNVLNQGSDSAVNISTFDNTTAAQRPFLLTTYYDERPDAPVLSVTPYEEDTFLPEYKWDAKADDLWYGLLHIDTKNIASQYHNANWRLHLNEDLQGYEKTSYNKIIKMTEATSAGADILYDYFSTTATGAEFNDRLGSGSGNVVVDATAKTITIAGYGDLTDTFTSGQFIDVRGMVQSGNNITNLEISGLTSTVITVSSATTLVNETRAIGFVTVGNVSSKKITFTSPGVDLTTIFQADDKIAIHHPTDNSTNVEYGRELTIATVAAAHVTVDETMTTTSIGSSTIKNQATPPDDRYDGLAGHTKHFLGTNKNVLSFKGHNASDEGHFSLTCHVVNDDVTISGTDYILYSRATDLTGSVDYNYYIAVNAQGNIVVSVQGHDGNNDNNAATTLTSASIIPTDGETPMHIAFTLDKDLPAQNLKLFINGVMEASSGVAVDAGGSNTASRWVRDMNMAGDSSSIFVGAEDQSGNNGFNGKIEEIVAYGDTIYPINPRDGKYLHTKPLEDFQGTGSSIAPQSYTARLFIKDYHNIRGSSATEIATSSLISFRKPVFDLRGG